MTAADLEHVYGLACATVRCLHPGPVVVEDADFAADRVAGALRALFRAEYGVDALLDAEERLAAALEADKRQKERISVRARRAERRR